MHSIESNSLSLIHAWWLMQTLTRACSDCPLLAGWSGGQCRSCRSLWCHPSGQPPRHWPAAAAAGRRVAGRRQPAAAPEAAVVPPAGSAHPRQQAHHQQGHQERLGHRSDPPTARLP